MDGKCTVGFHDSKTCGDIKRKKNPNQPLKLEIQELNVSSLFKTITTNHTCCNNVTYKEIWLIVQCIGVQLPQDSTIWDRHHSIYMHDYHKSARCQYPGQVELKKILSLTGISLQAAYQSHFLLGNATRRAIVPIGTS